MIFATSSILAVSGAYVRLAHLSNTPTWAEIATACIAFMALIGAFLQLWGTRAATRRRTAFGYFERWNDPQALPYIAEMARLLRKTGPEETDQERWERWTKGTHEQRLESILFVNFWEELGGLHNRRLVDREVIRQYLGQLIVTYWANGAWFVKCAGGDQPHVFEQWRKMSEDIECWLQQRDSPSRRRKARAWVFKRLLGWR